MTQKKKIELESIVLKLLKAKAGAEINIHDVTKAARLSSDNPAHRRAIQRALKTLTKEKEILAKGNARARVYKLIEKGAPGTEAPLLAKFPLTGATQFP